MCGIAGATSPLSPETIAALDRTLRHRGPDAGGHFLDNRVTLVFRRLAIIDLSPAGNQPMSNEDGTVWLVFNGEIYNFQPLRERLLAQGHHFRSRTDSEVVLHLYEQEGLAGLAALNGMFALALWDKTQGRLVLGRDHLGIKPLYYAERNGALFFASEIKGLLDLGVPCEVNWQGIADYFTFLHVPHPETAFRGVRALPPGTWLVWDTETRRTGLTPYWRLADFPVDGAMSAEEWGAELRRRLQDAVRRQLVSDVPLGILLSGGVDSTILTGLAAHALPLVRTFTITFRDRDATFYDERARAQRVSRRFGTVHSELEVAVDNLEETFRLVDVFDQPFGNPTALLNLLICRHARQSVTVALCGSGGDELFAGYPRYQAVGLARLAARAPAGILSVGVGLAGAVGSESSLRRRAEVFVEGLRGGDLDRYLRWTYYFGEERKRALLHPRVLAQAAPARRHLEPIFADRLSPLDAVQRADLATYLPDNILEYSDKTSMAVALELRVPYLDREVVEWVLRMPFGLKLRGRQAKWILRQACADLIPRENLAGGKQGFCPPMELWMRRYFDRYFDTHLARPYVEREGIFQWEALEQLRQEHARGARNHAMELFGIIMFDVWYRRFIRKDS